MFTVMLYWSGKASQCEAEKDAAHAATLCILHCVYYTVYGVLKKKKERRRLRSMLFQVFLYFLNYIYC